MSFSWCLPSIALIVSFHLSIHITRLCIAINWEKCLSVRIATWKKFLISPNQKSSGLLCLPAPHPHTQSSFILSPDFARQIIQEGGSTIEQDGTTTSAQKIVGLFAVYLTGVEPLTIHVLILAVYMYITGSLSHLYMYLNYGLIFKLPQVSHTSVSDRCAEGHT